MRIAIMGAGSVGSVLGGLLSERHEVTLIGRKDHVDAIECDGLALEGSVAKRAWPKAMTKVEAPDIHDLVVITAKSYDAPDTYHSVLPMVGPGSYVLIVQNGLDVLRSPTRIGFAPVNIGLVSMGASRTAPGRVRLSGLGKMTIGNLDGKRGTATFLKQIFAGSGLEVDVTGDIIDATWRKAIVNASINPLTALVGCKNGVILEDEDLRSTSQMLFDEAFEVARSWGIFKAGDMSYDDVERVISDTAENKSSMLQDIEGGRRTEIGSINGAMCAFADGEMAPINATITALIRAKERQVMRNER